jgi:hypothetical protein
MDWLEWIKQFPQQYLGQIKEGMIGAGEAGPLLGGGIVATALDPAWPLIQQTAEKVAETTAPAVTRGLNQQAVNYNMAMDSLREAGYDIPDYRMPESDEAQNREAMVAAMTAAGGAFRGKIPRLHTKATRNLIDRIKKRWKTDDDVYAMDLQIDDLTEEIKFQKREYGIPINTSQRQIEKYIDLPSHEPPYVTLPPEIYEEMMGNYDEIKQLRETAKYISGGGKIEAPIEVKEAKARVPEVIERHVPEARGVVPGEGGAIQGWHSFPDKIYTDFDSFIPEGTVLGGRSTARRIEIPASDINLGSPESIMILLADLETPYRIPILEGKIKGTDLDDLTKRFIFDLSREDRSREFRLKSLYNVEQLNDIKRQHNISDGTEALLAHSEFLNDELERSFQPTTADPAFEGLSDEAKEIIEAEENWTKHLESVARKVTGGQGARELKATVGAMSQPQSIAMQIARNDNNIAYLEAGGKFIDDRIRVIPWSGEIEKKYDRYNKIQIELLDLQEREYQGTISDKEYKKLQRYRDKTIPDLVEFLSEKLPNIEF